MKHSARLFAAVTLLLVYLAPAVHAQTIHTWTGSADSDFANASNWTGGAPYYQTGEGGEDVGYIDTGDTVFLNSVLPPTYPGGTLLDTLYVGNNSTLNVQADGGMTAILLYFGNNFGSTGTGIVTGTLEAIAPIYVGGEGNGSLTINSGGVVYGAVQVAVSAGSTGSFTVASGGSLLDSVNFSNTGSISTGDGDATIVLEDGSQLSGGVNVGGQGNSTLTINSGTVSIGGNLALEASEGGSVTAHVDGTTLGLNGILVNGSGNSSLSVDNNATFTTTGTGISEIGNTGSGYQTINVSGSSTTWTSSGSLLIGGTGNGTLNVQNGAVVTQQQITLGTGESGYGTLSIDSGGKVEATHLYVGASNNGSGSVTIDGASSDLHVTGNFTIGDGGSGSVMVSTGGSLRNGGEAFVGGTVSGTVTVAGSGSSWTSLDNITLAVGGGTGAVTLSDGGQLTIAGGSGHLYLNTAAAGFGTLNIGADASVGGGLAPGDLVAASVAGATAGDAVLVFNHTSAPYFFSPDITGGIYVVHKNGTTVLTGTNNYSEGTVIMGGTLALGANNALGTGDLNLAGGKIDLNSHGQASGLLTVTANSYIDFSSLTSALTVSDITFSGNAWLEIQNFDFGDDSFQVGINGSSLTGAELSHINIGGFIAQINGSGFLSASGTAFTAPVPEPATYAAFAGVAALGFAAWRRRRALVTVGVARQL